MRNTLALIILTVLLSTGSLTGSTNTIIVTRSRSYFKAPGQPARNLLRFFLAAPVGVEVKPVEK